MYKTDCMHHSILGPEDERSLLRRAQDGDRAAVDALVRFNQRLIIKIAQRFVNLNGDQELLDLIQWGNIGLLTAIERFDLSRGLRFSTYAKPWIKAYIRRYSLYAGSTLRLSYAELENQIKIRSAIAQLYQRNKSAPKAEEVAHLAGLPLQKVRRLMITDCKSLDACDDEDTPLHERLAATAPEPPEMYEEANSLSYLEEVVKSLPPRDRYVITHYYGLGGVKRLTLREIGSALGVSRERARQIEARVLKRLRGSLTAGVLRD